MRIKTLTVERFRCFGEKLTIDFARGNYFVLVGPNGAGKSNLVEAIRWASGNRSVSSDTVEVSDFHRCAISEPMNIEIELDQPIQKGDTFNKIKDVHFLSVTAREYSKGDQKGDIRFASLALDKDRKTVMTEMPIPRPKGKEFTQDEKAALMKALPLTVRDLRSDVNVFFLDPTNYEFNLSMRRGSLLFALSSVLGSDLFRDDAMTEFRGETRKRIDAIRELTGEIGSILESGRATDVLSGARDFMAEQMELPKDALGLNLTLPSGTDLIARLSLLARDGPDGPAIPIQNCGKGYSALAVVGLFRALTLAKAKPGFVLLVEEPESFLAPTVRSAFAAQLRAFADEGNQVIVVTHAPEFVDPFEPDQIIRLSKEGGGTKSRQWPQGESKPSFDRSLKFVEPNLGKIMFARRLLFVEGPDDIAAVREAMRVYNIDPAFHGMEVIRMDGKGNSRTFHQYVQPFNIPHAFLVDEDAEPGMKKFDPNGQRWSLMRPDLEGTLGTTKAATGNAEHVLQIVSACKDAPDLKSKHPSFYSALTDTLTKLGISVP